MKDISEALPQAQGVSDTPTTAAADADIACDALLEALLQAEACGYTDKWALHYAVGLSSFAKRGDELLAVARRLTRAGAAAAAPTRYRMDSTTKRLPDDPRMPVKEPNGDG